MRMLQQLARKSSKKKKYRDVAVEGRLAEISLRLDGS
jgi:hypothetical protein